MIFEPPHPNFRKSPSPIVHRATERVDLAMGGHKQIPGPFRIESIRGECEITNILDDSKLAIPDSNGQYSGATIYKIKAKNGPFSGIIHYPSVTKKH